MSGVLTKKAKEKSEKNSRDRERSLGKEVAKCLTSQTGEGERCRNVCRIDFRRVIGSTVYRARMRGTIFVLCRAFSSSIYPVLQSLSKSTNIT